MKIINLILSIAIGIFSSSVVSSCSNDDTARFEKDVNLTLSSRAVILPYEGGNINLQIESGYYWKIYGDFKWCNFSTIEGEPNSSTCVEIAADRNDSDAPRYIRLKVKSGYESKDLIVLQVGKSYVEPDRTGMEHTAMQTIYAIRKGWNLGNTLEAKNEKKFGTGVSMETDWGNPVVTKELIDKVYDYGYNGIRIPCGWQYQLMNETDPSSPDYNRIHPDWIVRVKEVVDYCMADKPGIRVLLNMHHAAWIDEKDAFQQGAVETSEPKMFAVWSQIAEAFRDYDDRLIFGACNEPEADDKASAEILKIYQQAFVNAVRATGGKNAYRKLIVQAPKTNCGLALTTMQLVSDFVPDCLGIEVHYYEPTVFCMARDESWGAAAYFWGKDFNQEPINGINRNSPNDEQKVDNLFPQLKAKFFDAGLPIIVGESGAVHKKIDFSPTLQQIHNESYMHYIKYTVSSMKKNGMVPFVWDTGDIINRKTFEITNQIQFDAMESGAETEYPIY